MNKEASIDIGTKGRIIPISTEITPNKKNLINKYLEYLLEYNRKVNLVSRKITLENLEQLVSETLELNRHISSDPVIDAGSGNGLLGIPVAILNINKRVVLVESRKKKVDFLHYAKTRLSLKNLEVHWSRIEDYLQINPDSQISMISRGFPRLEFFFELIKKRFIFEAVVITSENKLKKINLNMVNVNQKTYNLPLRDNLKILKMENVSRET